MIGITSGPVFVTLDVKVLAIVCGVGKEIPTGDGGLTVPEGSAVEPGTGDPLLLGFGPAGFGILCPGGRWIVTLPAGALTGDDGRPSLLFEGLGTSADACGSGPVGFSHWTLPVFSCS